MRRWYSSGKIDSGREARRQGIRAEGTDTGIGVESGEELVVKQRIHRRVVDVRGETRR